MGGGDGGGLGGGTAGGGGGSTWLWVWNHISICMRRVVVLSNFKQQKYFMLIVSFY